MSDLRIKLQIKSIQISLKIEVLKSKINQSTKVENQKWSKLWILHVSYVHIPKSFVLNIIANRKGNLAHTRIWCHQPGPCFYAQQKGADQGWDGRGLPLVRLGTASEGRSTGKLSPGCLADTRQASLTYEGLCPVYWGELSTSWPDGNEINFKFLVIL